MAELSPEVSEEILRRYADVLRVGRIRVNGEILRWETDTSTALQLRSFSERFFGRLSELLPDLSASDPTSLRFAAYWFCKAVSINYALIEVLLLIKQKVGVFCTVETREPGGGPLVEYVVDVRPEHLLQVSLAWSKGDNIVYRNPEHSKVQVKGTLSCLTTEFRIPPEEGFVPPYCLQMRLRRSLASRFASRLACGGTDRRKAKPDAETIVIDEPLHSPFALETPAELVARSPVNGKASPSCSAAALLASQLPEVPVEHTCEQARPTAHALWSAAVAEGDEVPLLDCDKPTSWHFGEESLFIAKRSSSWVGHLRVKNLRAQLLPQELQAPGARAPSPQPGGPELYATCLVPGRSKPERTRALCQGLRPEWPESWSLPVRMDDLRGDIVVEIYDNGMYGGTERLAWLGQATVPVSEALCDSGAVAVTKQLHGMHGTVGLELELLPQSLEEASLPTAEKTPNRLPGPWSEEEEYTLEVGNSFTLSRSASPPAPMAPGGSFDLGLQVKVRAATPPPPMVAAGPGLWCSRACSQTFY